LKHLVSVDCDNTADLDPLTSVPLENPVYPTREPSFTPLENPFLPQAVFC
jgi:hypothetical protein